MNKITIIPFLAIIAMSISLAGCTTPPEMCRRTWAADQSVSLPGCANPPDEIPAAYASPREFRELNCSQIGLEMARRSWRLSQLYEQLDGQARADVMNPAFFLLIAWPAFLLDKGGEDARILEYARLRGEMEALEDVGVGKGCAGLEAYRFKKPTGDNSTDTESSTQ